MSLLNKKSRGNSRLNPTSHNPFERFFRNDFMDLWNGAPDTMPSINIREQKDKFLVELAAPGLKKEDFNINVENDILTVSCEKESETNEDEKSEGFTRREYNYSSFSRSLALPENTDSSDISAKYEDGVLCLSIPKKPEAQREGGRKIKVD
jgi:HSP20 family protein